MLGLNTIISANVSSLLKQNGKKQKDLADALGVSKQVMSNMLSGARMINAIELRAIADYFSVTMERLMEAPADARDANAMHAFMGEVKTASAKRSLEIADEMADMVLFYARMRASAEEPLQAWEA